MLLEPSTTPRCKGMLGWVIFFFVLAVVAALLGLSGVAVIAAEIAWILFAIFVVLFIATLLVHLIRGRGPPPPV
jgi:uncharacterized membrane protein YtjA (UPF0391 family)